MKIHSEKRTLEHMKKPARVSLGTAGVDLKPPLTVVRVNMDFFQHHYYRLIKILLTLLGQWPYQSIGTRCRIVAMPFFLGTTASIPQLLVIVKFRNDWRIVLESFLPWLFATVSIVRFAGLIFNSQKILKLLNRIITNWQVWAQDREVNILHEYAKQGEKIIILYTVAIYSTVILYVTQPIMSKIIDVTLKNGTELGKFPFPVDYYYFDAQKCYYYIMMHLCVCACVITMPLVASDTMLIMCVQHVCGVFAALACKLQQMGNNDRPVEKPGSPFELEKRNVVDLASLIDRHNDAIEFANLIDATYTWIFCFNIGIGLILINTLGFQILVRTDDPKTTIIFVAMVLTLELVFYTECYISQMLKDHSINVGYYIYNSQWYRLSPKVQKLLQLMSMRCRVPCQLTAGRMLIMSLRTFGLTFRTAMSYFAVVRNMDDELNSA